MNTSLHVGSCVCSRQTANGHRRFPAFNSAYCRDSVVIDNFRLRVQINPQIRTVLSNTFNVRTKWRADTILPYFQFAMLFFDSITPQHVTRTNICFTFGAVIHKYPFGGAARDCFGEHLSLPRYRTGSASRARHRIHVFHDWCSRFDFK